MRGERSRRFSGPGSTAIALGMALMAPLPAQAQSKVQSAYEQLCGHDKTASATTCTALANELAAERAGLSQQSGGNQTSGDIAAGLFHQLSSRAYFYISADEVAHVLTLDWDAAKREATFTVEMPGISVPDVHTVLIAPSGSFTGLRNFVGSKYKFTGRVTGQTSFEIDPYKIGWGAGSLRQRYTLLPTGELSVLSEQFKNGQWCCAYEGLHKPIDRQELAKLHPRLVESGRAFQAAYNERAEAEKRQRRQERAELFGQLMQGALVATQAYAAGVQEANASNARAQALIASAIPVRPQVQPNAGAAGSVRIGASAEPSPSMPVGAAIEPALQNRTVRAYFVTGLEPTPGDTRNPLCYSNVFSVTFPWDPKGWGNAGRGAEATAKYAPIFREKCAKLGKVSGPMPAANIEGVTTGWPFPPPHPTDRRVTLP